MSAASTGPLVQSLRSASLELRILRTRILLSAATSGSFQLTSVRRNNTERVFRSTSRRGLCGCRLMAKVKQAETSRLHRVDSIVPGYPAIRIVEINVILQECVMHDLRSDLEMFIPRFRQTA